jgi:hypothetical protein
MDPVAAFAQQAKACEALGSPMYAGLLHRLSEDLEVGGPTRRVLVGHEDDPGPSALALRLLGSVHRLVLERRAGALAAYYPSVGGTWDPDEGTAAFLALLGQEPEAVREWLDRPPQTNEVGRSAALMGGLLHLGPHERRPVRLFEIGSSGGLNLLAERYEFVDTEGGSYGTRGSSAVLEPAWTAATLDRRRVPIAHRLGSDPMPIDATSTEGRLALTAYVWPDQTQRLERLRAALVLAQEHPPAVRRMGAADFVERIALRFGEMTVLWHSVMWQYLSSEEQQRVTERVEELAAAADDNHPFVHLFLEPTRRVPEGRHEFLVVLTAWPGGVRRILGKAAPHGLPVTWE